MDNLGSTLLIATYQIPSERVAIAGGAQVPLVTGAGDADRSAMVADFNVCV